MKKRWGYLAVVVLAAAALGGCGGAEKRYVQAIQDTNDRIERMRKAEAEADAELAKALVAAASGQPALVAAVTSNVMMARALRGGAGVNGQAFVTPERPRSFSEEARAWVGAVAPFLVAGYQANRSAYVQVKQGEFDYLRFVASENGQTARVSEIANMAIGLKPNAPNVTTTTTTNTFGRDGNVGSGTQQNNNSTTSTCAAGNGAQGGDGGSGGNGGTQAGAPGAAGASGGSGGSC